MSKEAALKQIEEEVLHLTASPLYEYRVSNNYVPVIGEGSLDAQIMFVGEAPGKNEAKTGKPFIGSAGKILDGLLESVDIQRSDVYITSIVKDRPQKNRDPLPIEIELYGPFLDRQIDIIQPNVIAALGRYAMGYLLEKFGLASENKGISAIHGKTFKANASYGEVTIVPLYHPAAVIYNHSLKAVLREDFKVLRQF